MDDKEKDLNTENLSETNNEDLHNDDFVKENDAADVKYEENDNWEFEAQAPTLSNDYFLKNDKFVVEDDVKPEKVQSEIVNANIENNSDSFVIKKEPLKFIPLALITLIVIAVLVVLGVRYYTVPNGYEGDKMNPASVAATIDGDKVSIGMFNYYFSSVVNYYEQYAAYGYFDLDTSADYSTQYTENKDGERVTWLERMTEEAMQEIEYTTALYNKGREAGITVSESQQETIDSQIESLKSTASASNISLNEYLSKNFGEYCTEDTIRLMLEQYYVTLNYKGQLGTQRDYTDDDINNYFEEHKNDYYKINYCFAALPYDESSEEAKAASNEAIKKYEDQITDRDSIIKLVPTLYADYIEQDIATSMQNDSSLTEEEARKNAIEVYESNVDAYMLGSEEPFGKEINEWLFSENTKIGDTNHYIDTQTGYAYILVKTEEPQLLEDETYTVRHILITPTTQTDENVAQEAEEAAKEPTEEDWAAAEKKAQEILDKFNESDKSEYSFALLAEENSTDYASTSSSSTEYFGGLYEATALGAMVPEFESWATDKSREYGDTGIVKSDYGYHIMFFVNDKPEYQARVIKDIRDNNIDNIVDSAEVKIHDRIRTKAINDFFASKKAQTEQMQSQASGSTAGTATQE